MTDSSNDSRDDYILQERMAGKSTRALARELRCSTREIDAALDRSLPLIDTAARMRHIAADLLRLESLLKVFVKKSVEQEDCAAGLLVVKILERKSALLGLDQPTKLDVLQITAAPAKSSIDQIREAIDRIAGRVGSNGSEPTDESGPH